MPRVHVHVHLPASKKVKDGSMSGKSDSELNRIIKNQSTNEGDVGAALQELARRGIDPRTGKTVGRAEASRIAREMGENAPG